MPQLPPDDLLFARPKYLEPDLMTGQIYIEKQFDIASRALNQKFEITWKWLNFVCQGAKVKLSGKLQFRESGGKLLPRVEYFPILDGFNHHSILRALRELLGK